MWNVVSASVQGASHQRTGKPNQDAVDYLLADELGSVVIAAVADGHGNANAFRSGIGAQLAVKSAIEHLSQQVQTLDRNVPLTAVRRLAEEQWPRNILVSWRDAVLEHWDITPLDASEAVFFGAADTQALLPCDISRYGTTLLACVATPRFIVYLQLGDGDIVVLSEDGCPGRPLGRDPRLFGNATTSLANGSAWHEWRTHFNAIDSDELAPPPLIMLSTDGYANSFQDDSGFLQVAMDLAVMLRSHGSDYVASELPGWLKETSTCGSGDDVTVCVICRNATALS